VYQDRTTVALMRSKLLPTRGTEPPITSSYFRLNEARFS
jgi:hypothetical protein